jgi:arsenate reductase (thioredoxin)
VSGVKQKRVLFVCIGNCCRSQMAEGFAREYGGDTVAAESAGLAPAGMVVEETIRAMAQRRVDVSNQYSKAFRLDEANECDIVVNMSGLRMPEGVLAPVLEWDVRDPIGQTDEVYAKVRDQIETLVTDLIWKLRRARSAPRGPG